MCEHTPTPWEWEVMDKSMLTLGTKGRWLMEGAVLSCTRCKACQEREVEKARCMWPNPEDSTFIVRACNAHDDLVAACALALEHFNDIDIMESEHYLLAIRDSLENAIAKARGNDGPD